MAGLAAYNSAFVALRLAGIGGFRSSLLVVCDWRIFILIVANGNRSLPRRSAVHGTDRAVYVVMFDSSHQRFRHFNSTIPSRVIWVKCKWPLEPCTTADNACGLASMF